MAHPFEIVVERDPVRHPRAGLGGADDRARRWTAGSWAQPRDARRRRRGPDRAARCRPGVDASRPGSRRRRFVHVTPEGDDGRAMTFDVRDRGAMATTALRFVHSGVLPDDEWESRIRRTADRRSRVHRQARDLPEALPRSPRDPTVPGGADPMTAEQCWSILRRELGRRTRGRRRRSGPGKRPRGGDDRRRGRRTSRGTSSASGPMTRRCTSSMVSAARSCSSTTCSTRRMAPPRRSGAWKAWLERAAA